MELNDMDGEFSKQKVSNWLENLVVEEDCSFELNHNNVNDCETFLIKEQCSAEEYVNEWLKSVHLESEYSTFEKSDQSTSAINSYRSSGNSCASFRSYTSQESKAIIKYILANDASRFVKGNLLWKRMELDKVCNRSWSSMRNHFLKKINPYMHNYLPEGSDSLKRLIHQVPTSPRCKKSNLLQPGERGWRRNARYYSSSEDFIIIKFLLKKNRYHYALGNNMWKYMESKKVLVGRSWQSIKSRFLNNILRNLSDYNLEEKNYNRLIQIRKSDSQKIISRRKDGDLRECSPIAEKCVEKKGLEERKRKLKSEALATATYLAEKLDRKESSLLKIFNIENMFLRKANENISENPPVLEVPKNSVSPTCCKNFRYTRELVHVGQEIQKDKFDEVTDPLDKCLTKNTRLSHSLHVSHIISNDNQREECLSECALSSDSLDVSRNNSDENQHDKCMTKNVGLSHSLHVSHIISNDNHREECLSECAQSSDSLYVSRNNSDENQHDKCMTKNVGLSHSLHVSHIISNYNQREECLSECVQSSDSPYVSRINSNDSGFLSNMCYRKDGSKYFRPSGKCDVRENIRNFKDSCRDLHESISNSLSNKLSVSPLSVVRLKPCNSKPERNNQRLEEKIYDKRSCRSKSTKFTIEKMTTGTRISPVMEFRIGRDYPLRPKVKDLLENEECFPNDCYISNRNNENMRISSLTTIKHNPTSHSAFKLVSCSPLRESSENIIEENNILCGQSTSDTPVRDSHLFNRDSRKQISSCSIYERSMNSKSYGSLSNFEKGVTTFIEGGALPPSNTVRSMMLSGSNIDECNSLNISCPENKTARSISDKTITLNLGTASTSSSSENNWIKSSSTETSLVTTNVRETIDNIANFPTIEEGKSNNSAKSYIFTSNTVKTDIDENWRDFKTNTGKKRCSYSKKGNRTVTVRKRYTIGIPANILPKNNTNSNCCLQEKTYPNTSLRDSITSNNSSNYDKRCNFARSKVEEKRKPNEIDSDLTSSVTTEYFSLGSSPSRAADDVDNQLHMPPRSCSKRPNQTSKFDILSSQTDSESLIDGGTIDGGLIDCNSIVEQCKKCNLFRNLSPCSS